VTLRRGVTVRGQVLGPDGQPLPRAVLFCGGELLGGQTNVLRLSWLDGDLGRAVLLEGGRFELPGCDPEKTYRLFFLDAPREAGGDGRGSILNRPLRDGAGRRGAVVDVSARQAGGGPVTVRLAPCAAVEFRCPDARGRPLKRVSGHAGAEAW